jgi:hypothetical protein
MNCFTKKMFGLAVVSAISVMMFGCAGAKSLKKDTGEADNARSVYPPAIEKLLDGKYAQSIKAVGIATHPDQTVALEKAGLDADQKLAKQFEEEIASLQKKFLEAVNDQKLEEYRNTVENFVNIKIEGVTIVKEMSAEGKDGYKAYVLKVVSAETLKNLIDQRINAQTHLKAVQAYKELEDRVAKDNAAKAAEKDSE